MFCSTFCYWTAVHDPGKPSCSASILAQSLNSRQFCFAEIHPFDLLNLMVHALLALLMLGDLIIVGHPVRMDPGMQSLATVHLMGSIFRKNLYKFVQIV